MHITFSFFPFYCIFFSCFRHYCSCSFLCSNKCMFYFILHYFIFILFLFPVKNTFLFIHPFLSFHSLFPPSCTNNSFIFFQLYFLFNISILMITITILINSILHSPNIIIIIIIKNKTSYFNDPYNISLQSIKYFRRPFKEIM